MFNLTVTDFQMGLFRLFFIVATYRNWISKVQAKNKLQKQTLHSHTA